LSNFIDELVAAAGRHGVPCVVLAGHAGNGVSHDDDDDDVAEVVAPFMAPAAGADTEEVEKLRSQVQKLTAELAARPVAASHSANANLAAMTVQQVPGGNLGSMESQSVEALGFEDDALTKKLLRLGFETIGKLRTGLMTGALAGDDIKLKKDWLIEVGMKLAGAGPSSGGGVAPSSPAPASSPGAGDVPAGHKDRPWLERLAAAKQKQHELDEGRAKLAVKQAEMAKLVKAKKEVPTDFDDQIVAIEETLMKDEARLLVLRWAMNLDFDPAISLDESLQRANLGPWMSAPQPRIAPQ
jgi:hypothetical protein